ncbi:50S ribosomal protein L3 [Buchnera aphidicola str. Bp (Baizongia pistaciae)]|uniref:Large ribosomal subunit protein uL3 n=1 Tax=Buchnera aphidicola subsp. Baizongia pistaciae (strain Bp) TaxID=224915 RepID=RL3_BUCBP|nr:50S ribosomal protein L3 [Buchnera aphidicola]Q89A68.1 RecName: Full=Large ribosomal subunit protein uL3; AltName: Full=50S ribosomal protein L3 [Buchnera aphidicola str. Bp (Baizongia pistaciae)]AAO27173.1 50S ribosomal protein L3 [Buchnera aphidicola str. Bp (Baizongia pistaciae)]
MMGLIGQKLGMTRIFTEEGTVYPVTIIKVKENRITQIKTISRDLYHAVQVTTGIKKSNKLLKPEIGHFLKSGVKIGKGLWEFKLTNSSINDFKIGQSLNLELFSNIKKVDIIGTSKGKGFCGTVKRWNFHTQDATHGNSLSHRAPGSIGQNQTPGRVFKGKKMAGHLGNHRVTVQNLDIVKIDLNQEIILVKGAVPGYSGGNIIIKPAIKTRGV